MTMYDKLGDLLSEALRTGELPETSKDSPEVQFFYIPKEEKKNPEKNENASPKKEASRTSENKKNQTGIRIPREKIRTPAPITKIISEEVKTALSFVGIPENAGFDEAKKIYREKLMYYHPDRRNDNPVLQKVAKEKTARLLKEWAVIENWFSN